MTLKQAIIIVERYNKWRRSGRGKMLNPTEIGEALDILLFIAKLEAKTGETDNYHIHPREV